MLRGWFLLCSAGVGVGLVLTTGAAAATTDLPAPTRTDPVAAAASGAGPVVLTGIRTGQHATYDRTVFDFTGGTPGYRVEYGTLVHQAKDEIIPLAGDADLVVVFDGVAEVRDTAARDPRLPTLLQIKSGGVFEGYASYGLGLADRVGFRVLTLHNPDRIAVDVAHQPAQAFGSATVSHAGTAPDALVEAVRSGRHPGYDRLVFDMDGSQPPAVSVSYVGSGSTIRVTFTGQGSPTQSPHASFAGPAAYTFGLPALRTLSFTVVGAGVMTADVGTARRGGFRVMLLQQPTRVVLDVQS
ncbi:AMIN domain-containing protein [Dactylosporangium sp. NPDC049525]|uniref:AMIN-like domain-containing (lipo)protein n=1 Tax=Dactylosporangium sp. NPDC049525 TaxID=3154730 RepID=UPI0034377335